MKKNLLGKTDIVSKLILGALAILIVRTIFEDDTSRIISSKGRKILADENKMKEIEKELEYKREVFI